MKTQTEYFFIEFDPDGKYAALEFSEPDQESFELSRPVHVSQKESFKFKFSSIPKISNPKTADYHYFNYLVFSKKITKILHRLNLPGIEYLPAEITDKKGNIYSNYNIIHICNRIPCMDKERSAWRAPLFDKEKVMAIDILTLDSEKLNAVPLSDRRLFNLSECPAYTLFHKSIVDSILASKPTGLKFVSARISFNTPANL